jgi:hypothetical protein
MCTHVLSALDQVPASGQVPALVNFNQSYHDWVNQSCHDWMMGKSTDCSRNLPQKPNTPSSMIKMGAGHWSKTSPTRNKKSRPLLDIISLTGDIAAAAAATTLDDDGAAAEYQNNFW